MCQQIFQATTPAAHQQVLDPDPYSLYRFYKKTQRFQQNVFKQISPFHPQHFGIFCKYFSVHSLTFFFRPPLHLARVFALLLLRAVSGKSFRV